MTELSAAAKHDLVERLDNWIGQHAHNLCQRWGQFEQEEIEQVMRERLVRELEKFDVDRHSNPDRVPYFKWMLTSAAKDYARLHGDYDRHGNWREKPISLSTPIGEQAHGEVVTLLDVLPAPEEYESDAVLRSKLREAIGMLTDREVRAINRIYFLDQGIEATARELGVTGDTIHKTLRIAIAKMRKHLSPDKYEPSTPGVSDVLAQREFEVLESAAAGDSSQKTADKLGLSLETVKSHRKGCIMTLEAENIANAISIAYQRGILKIPEEHAA